MVIGTPQVPNGSNVHAAQVYGKIMRPLSLLLHLLPIALAAQHCGYDFAAIIVVHPHATHDSLVVPGLRITLLDSTNLPLSHSGVQLEVFHQNTDMQACDHGPHGTYKGQPCCFPFAKDDYILVVRHGMDLSHMKLLVQDERDVDRTNKRRSQAAERSWPMRFEQQVIPLTDTIAYSLCGTYDEEVYHGYAGEHAYHSVDIPLTGR